MIVKGEKIRELIEDYGKANNIAEKSFLRQFTEEFDLNYAQWSNYIRGEQNLGLKPIEKLIEIFPYINLNWLLKDYGEKYIVNNITPYPEAEDPELNFASEVDSELKITNEMLMKKLELMHSDIQNSFSK